jgi:hypothetical protein
MGFRKVTRGQIYGQLKALSRTSILYLGRDLLEAYNFGQYVHEVESFYRLRNDIVHGRSPRLPAKIVINRMFRFRRLLQKLLFSMAGIYGIADAFRAPIESQDLSAI